MTLNIIHNPDRLDRKVKLLQQLEEQGVTDYKLWDAIFDVDLTCRGINKAHKQIVQWAKENELPEVLIAEDDILFTDKGAFDFYLKNKPNDFDLYLGGIFLGEIKEGIAGAFTGLTLYMVNQNFYNTFLNANEDEHLDGALAWSGKYVVCEPFVCRQWNGYSDNEKKIGNYDHIFENRNMYKSM